MMMLRDDEAKRQARELFSESDTLSADKLSEEFLFNQLEKLCVCVDLRGIWAKLARLGEFRVLFELDSTPENSGVESRDFADGYGKSSVVLTGSMLNELI